MAIERDQAQCVEARRSQLRADRQAIIDTGRQVIDALNAQERREQQRLEQLERRIMTRVEQTRARRTLFEGKRQELTNVLATAASGLRASRRQAVAGCIVTARTERVARSRRIVEHVAQLEGNEKLALQQLAAIQREAGQATLKAVDLARRFGLTAQVPCSGTALQGDCKLLGDAREAKSLMPNADLQINRLAQQQSAVKNDLTAIRENMKVFAGAGADLRFAEHRLQQARERTSRFGVLAAKATEIAFAAGELSSTDQELIGLRQAEVAGDTIDESAERQRIATACKIIAEEREREAAKHQDALNRIDSALAAVPAAYDGQKLIAAGCAVERAVVAVASAEQAHLAAVRDAQALDMANRQAAATTLRKARVGAHATAVEGELGRWLLFAKCLSTDGVIALAIDDAGPALSGLANDLLLACYGARFTVSIKTLMEIGKGAQREGFDIVVHDGEAESGKSVSVMSGGERVWINECLTRAIALYLAQHSGRRYTTLFSDEADGSLDEERKRMFMAMKREVLRLGGYEREVFVSQTPELTAMADAVIDLEAMAISFQPIDPQPLVC